MSDYSMPVLSEQERQELIGLAAIEVKRWEIADGKQYMVELMNIALAGLTAEPVAFGYEGGLFECGGKISSTATRHYVNPLYTAPPVPVIKQEGGER